MGYSYWLKALTVGKVSFGLRFRVPWTMTTMIVAQKKFVTYRKRKKRRMTCFLCASPDG
jgi:hypothetical protein